MTIKFDIKSSFAAPFNGYSVSMADKKRLMAESEQILRQGYSMGDQEYIDGMTAGEVLINGEISRFTGTASFHARLPGPQ